MAHGTVKKSDKQQQLVWAELYVPDVPDAQNDFMRAEEIAKAAYAWMRKSDTHCIDIEHDGETVNAYVVESFIARDDDPTFIPGAWVIGVHIPDTGVWDMVQKGELNGFSMYGNAMRSGAIDMEVPSEVTGLTKTENGHEHEFFVAYGPKGEFIGGHTNEVDGHYHLVRRGTLTEEAEGHFHQFDFVRGFVNEDREA